jgi:hypothetical protein
MSGQNRLLLHDISHKNSNNVATETRSNNIAFVERCLVIYKVGVAHVQFILKPNNSLCKLLPCLDSKMNEHLFLLPLSFLHL